MQCMLVLIPAEPRAPARQFVSVQRFVHVPVQWCWEAAAASNRQTALGCLVCKLPPTYKLTYILRSTLRAERVCYETLVWFDVVFNIVKPHKRIGRLRAVSVPRKHDNAECDVELGGAEAAYGVHLCLYSCG